MTDYTPPHSLEVERAIIGAILISPSVWPEVSSEMSADDLFRQAHREIFASFSALVASSRAIDILTVVADLRERGLLDECGGPAYLSACMDGVPKSSNVTSYVQIVVELSKRRRLGYVGHWLLAEAFVGENQTSATVADSAFAKLLEATSQKRSKIITSEQAAQDYISAIMAGTHGTVVNTGFVDVDHLMGGMRTGDMVIVAARPSVGKSAFAFSVADDIATRQNGVPMVFSLEMTARSLAARHVGWKSGVQSSKIERGDLTDVESQAVVSVVTTQSERPILIHENAATVTEIYGWVRRAMQQYGKIPCVIVDYLQLLRGESKASSRQDEVTGISRMLKAMAKDLDVVVMALSQLSRSPEDRRDKRPHLSDLRESGALEQDADIVMLLFREEMHRPKPENDGVAEVIIAKNRNGPVGVTRLAFAKHLAQFRNLSTQEPR